MAGKKVFMLRVNPEVYEALEKWAADEFRSVNGQLEWVVEKALREVGRTPRKTPVSTKFQEKTDDSI